MRREYTDIAKRRATKKRLRDQRYADGLCERCPQPRGDATLCCACAEKRQARRTANPSGKAARARVSKRRRDRRYAAGLCRLCPQPRLSGRALCARCVEKENQRKPAPSVIQSAFLHYFNPAFMDRRHNGEHQAALGWVALERSF